MGKMLLVNFIFSSVLLSNVQARSSTGDYDHRLEAVLGHYFDIQKALASDSLEGVRQAADAIVKLTETKTPTDTLGKIFLQQIGRVAKNMQGEDLTTTRQEFSELSNRLIAALRLSYSGGEKYYPFNCRMEHKSWIQLDEKVRNPYLGSAMLQCGEAVSLSSRK